MKVRMREQLNLPPLTEDSVKVVRNMRAASPPATAMELIEQQQQQKRGRRSRRVRETHTRMTFKAVTLAETTCRYMNTQPLMHLNLYVHYMKYKTQTF